MSGRRLAALLLIVAASAPLLAGGEAEIAGTGGALGKLSVFVSIPPQRYFVSIIAGERAGVEVMLPPGRNPATYEPTPRQMVALGAADLFFTIGVPFEQAFLPQVRRNLPDLRIVPVDRGIEKRMLADHDHGHEAQAVEGDDVEHEGEAPDPHIWLDPLLVIEQAAVMRDALIEVDPAGEAAYRAGYERLAGEMRGLHAELKSLLAPAAGTIFFVYHPSFGYFADRYGLRQVAVETGGREPRAAQLEEIIEHAREEGVKTIFVQPEFPRGSADAVARAIGGRVVAVEPLREEYPANLRRMAEIIREGSAE